MADEQFSRFPDYGRWARCWRCPGPGPHNVINNVPVSRSKVRHKEGITNNPFIVDERDVGI
ncbi:MAG: hypothetical protein ACYDB2_08060 [Acidimicrobiales bacterium]